MFRDKLLKSLRISLVKSAAFKHAIYLYDIAMVLTLLKQNIDTITSAEVLGPTTDNF